MIENPAKLQKELLTKFMNKEITQEQLDFECAMWYLDCFSEIRHKPEPTMPKRFADYDCMQQHEKRDVPKEFWHIPEVKSYLDQKELVKNENTAKLHWLKYFSKFIPENDFTNRDLYRQKIADFIY